MLWQSYGFLLFIRQKEVSHQLVRSPNTHKGQSWASLKPEARSSIRASHVGRRNPITAAITTASQALHSHEVGVRNQSWVSNQAP